MTSTQGYCGLTYFPEEEANFAAASALRDADHAFARSRKRALWRRLRSIAGLVPTSRMPGPTARSLDLELPAAEITGMIEAGRARAFKPLPLSVAPAWRAEFIRALDTECIEAFTVSWSSGHYYLEGGTRERIRLEVCESRGLPLVPVVLSPLASLSMTAPAQAEEACCEEEGQLAC